MKSNRPFFVIVVLAAVTFGVVRHLNNKHSESAAEATTDGGDEAPEAEIKPVASVWTAPAVQSEISESINAYGTVVSQPGAAHEVVAPLEMKLVALRVSEGQVVKQGDPMADVEPSPETLLAFQQARATAEAATRAANNMRQRYALNLVATQDLDAAESEQHQADVTLESLTSRGGGVPTTLLAPADGVVGKIDAAPGQILAAGAPIAAIDDPDHVEVRIGVEPTDAGRLTVGQSVDVHTVGAAAQAATATLRMVGHRMNTETRLVDMYATLPDQGTWLLDSPVTAKIVLEKKEAVVVPREAALLEDGAYTLYTVADKHAVKHVVTLGLNNNKSVEIAEATPPVSKGDTVVVRGNYELEADMQVEVVTSP